MSKHKLIGHFNTDTKLVLGGRDPEAYGGAVNPPVFRASTILFETLEDFWDASLGKSKKSSYARYGTPQTDLFAEQIAALEEADHAFICSTGMQAVTTGIMSFLNAGDHMLIVDSVYGPVRDLCDRTLPRFGIEVTYYDPALDGEVEKLVKPNTKVIYVESPGSMTFELQDIPAIAQVAQKHGCVLIADTTWSSPTLMKAYPLGIDVQVYSGSKYISGHSDLLLGVITCKKEHYGKVRRTYLDLGVSPSPDDIYLAQRGIRTLNTRLKQHQRAAMEIAQWLQQQPEVREIRYPALPGSHGHEIWKRDFQGASGLMGFVMDEVPFPALAAMMDGMALFGMGFSWGGYESLLIPPPKVTRAASTLPDGQLMRLHAGLEDIGDLIEDLRAGFERMRAAR